MALSLTHAFTSPKVDGPDTTVVRPSDWNDEHDITLSGRSVIGKTTVGSGPAEQIDISAAVLAVLQSADNAAILTALGVTPDVTGDARYTMRTAAPTGWILMTADGTIGSATSGASIRANADCADLFALIWDGVSNTYAPIYDSAGNVSSRGGSAASDFAANKRLLIPLMVGRALAGAGQGSSLTNRPLGMWDGAETVALTEANLGAHTHSINASVSASVSTSVSVSVSVSGSTGFVSNDHTHAFSGTTSGQSADHSHSGPDLYYAPLNAGGAFNGWSQTAFNGPIDTGNTGGTSNDHSHTYSGSTGGISANHNHTVSASGSGSGSGSGSATGTATGTSGSAGSGTAHANMQPTSFAFRIMIKL
jgi:hypothetical protein